jgi:hypothetical protein
VERRSGLKFTDMKLSQARFINLAIAIVAEAILKVEYNRYDLDSNSSTSSFELVILKRSEHSKYHLPYRNPARS